MLAQGPFVSANAASRIKDLVDFEGIRENQLVGYGPVDGLNGTGDSRANSPFTRQSLQAMLERLGINTRDVDLRTTNVAAVMVTGNLPPFATQESNDGLNGLGIGPRDMISILQAVKAVGALQATIEVM